MHFQVHYQKYPRTTSDLQEVTIVFQSSKGGVKLAISQDAKFQDVSRMICDILNLELSKTRFLLDGERIQSELTLNENQIADNSTVEVFEELIGGKGPSEDQIRDMLDNYKSDGSDSDEAAENSDPYACDSDDYKWYVDLKQQLQNGVLKLQRSNHLDEKLIFLLDTEYLEPYEILRLKNVYSCWEQHQVWKGDEDSPGYKEIKTSSIQSSTPSRLERRPKRVITVEHQQTNQTEDESTPIKRAKLMETMGLNTPSPLLKMSKITYHEMKQISVSVHLWAERNMGGVKFLQTTRLGDFHFKEIMKFAGPGSKWNLMKDRTMRQLRSLWRNTLGGKDLYRGQHKTGYENDLGMHSPLDPYCPFGHCSSGMMSPMDRDLILLTPKETSPIRSPKKHAASSRKLFHDGNEPHAPQEISKELKDAPSDMCVDGSKNETVEEEESVLSSSQDDSALNSSQEDSTNFEVRLEEDESGKVSCSNNNEKTSQGLNFSCDICGKVFHTFFGLERHNADKHSNIMIEKLESTCNICNKKVIYLDQHMKVKHSDVQKVPVCEICQKEVDSNMLRHRKFCIKCRFCDYTNSKKARLLKHISKCTKSGPENALVMDEEPLDLRSPLKLGNKNKNDEVNSKVFMKEHFEIELSSEIIRKEKTDSDQATPMDDFIMRPNSVDQKSDNVKESLERARRKYPIDHNAADEEYYSELDIDDEDIFTMERRKYKDDIEVKLRAIDMMENENIEGDNIIVQKFSDFMRNKHRKSSNDVIFSKQTEPSTIELYSKVVRNDILKSFHKLVVPFDSRWLTDCVTDKECTFDGEERYHVEPTEPIYLTSRILQEALDTTSFPKKRVISAFNQLMDFIELNFTLKLNTYGIDVLNRVINYHKGVKSFIKAKSLWKTGKSEENEAFEKNKLIKTYKNPNKDTQVLESYKEYLTSEARLCKINDLLSYAHPDAPIPKDGLMTDFGNHVMEEIIACTGCRPKVAYHLTMGSMIDAKPGFNPHDTDGEDVTLEDEVDGEKIWRRTNPNLPPRKKACNHQLRDKSAFCSENCGNQCVPEGYNFWIQWDKTMSTKGPYFLHIPRPIKKLMDRYDLIRSKFFKDKKPENCENKQWLEEADCPFFLNSNCNSFSSVNLKKLSSILQIDVTAYSFRRIVCTWALSHKLKEIREAEEIGLQHSLEVAKERYMQNKQVVPQKLVQTYAEEENLFPQKFKDKFEKDKAEVEVLIGEKQEKRAEARFSKLLKEKDDYNKLRFENRPLGPRNTVVENDRREFSELFELTTRNKLVVLVKSLKPIQWRDILVRHVCSCNGEHGDRLRVLWIQIYKGDLLFGVRDKRKAAKQSNWPVRKNDPGRKDRNSWIAYAIRKSCLAALKFDEN